MLLCLMASTVLLVVRPYKRHDDNLLAVASSIVLSCAFFCSLLIKLFSEAELMGAEDDNSAQELLGFSSTFEIAMMMFIFCICYLTTVVGALVSIAYTAIKRAAATQIREDAATINKAIESLGKLQHPAVLTSYDKFSKYESLQTHEVLRSKGDLTIFDTYEEFKTFCNQSPVIFVSHQWLSDNAPDPDGHQFKIILEVCAMLCVKLGVAISDLYIWIDYCSIPQANKTLQFYAISSLPIYASCVRYFLVVAPPVAHAHHGRMCDVETYKKRGWYRLAIKSKNCPAAPALRLAPSPLQASWARLPISQVPTRAFCEDGLRQL